MNAILVCLFIFINVCFCKLGRYEYRYNGKGCEKGKEVFVEVFYNNKCSPNSNGNSYITICNKETQEVLFDDGRNIPRL